MNKLSKTTEGGEVYTATLFNDLKGWYVDRNGTYTVFVPFSRIIEVDGISRMATVIDEALSIGQRLIDLSEEYFTHFEKSHPELNP